MKSPIGASLILLVMASSSVGHARATTLHVANDGADSATCGAAAGPCRSIGRAIANATGGDTILVGPGAYGDLTGNDDFLTAGEEPGGAACGSAGVICIDKPLRIESTHGARATVYHGYSSNSVQILADNVVFGQPGQGFTVTGDLQSGVGGVIHVADGTSGVVVAGNALPDSTIVVEGTGHTIAENELAGGSNGSIVVQGSGHIIRHNVLSAGVVVGLQGIFVLESGNSVVGNTLIGLTNAIVIGEGVTGITIQGNSILAGGPYGVLISDGSSATISGNNIFGRPQQVGRPEWNCGIFNDSGTTIDASDNYWGVATGPGPDPADDICEGRAGSVTTATSFATQPFSIQLPGSSGGGANASPVCNAALAAPSTLWPANGQLTRVWIVGVGDPDDDPVSISIISVTQDEPTSGLGAGDVGPDATLSGSSVDLRAQRDGGGNGRVYRVGFTASDGHGASCTGSVNVGVPNSQKPGQAVVDDGQAFVATLP